MKSQTARAHMYHVMYCSAKARLPGTMTCLVCLGRRDLRMTDSFLRVDWILTNSSENLYTAYVISLITWQQ